ncbi:MAG: hypothetical protein U0791_13695 [Gemmataceae bacterium]
MNDVRNARPWWLSHNACGFGSLALSALAARSPLSPHSEFRIPSSKDPLAAKKPPLPAKRPSASSSCSYGAASAASDSFDHKPRLDKDDGKQLPFDDARILANTGAAARRSV